MSRLAVRHVARHLFRSESLTPPPTDAELLALFAATHDEDAFAELVARHGGLVRGTARRCVRDAHVAEDVYQAVFLVLASKAGAIRWGVTVGPWLHATTVRLARKALRRTRPAPATSAEVSAQTADPAAALVWAECCQVLDEELAALPEVLRRPLVLCYLQGYTRDEAASALGCSLAMLKRRLERGRNRLRDRLTRRGISLPAAGIGLLACELGVSAAGIAETTAAAVAFVARGTASPGAVALLEVARTGFHLKAMALVAVASVLVVCGVALANFASPTEEKPGTPNDPPATAPRAEEKANADGPGDPLPAGAVARLGTLRLRPGHVDRVAFAPDGTKLASWSAGELTIWDTKTGRTLRQFELPGAHLSLLVWLADGRGIALISGHDEPAPLIWEFTDEKAEKPVVKPPPRAGKGTFAINPNQPVEDNEYDGCYTISPDGKVLVIGKAGQSESDREVQLWELKTGVRLNTLKPLKGGFIHPGNCNDVRFSPDGKTLVVITHAKYLGGTKYEPDQLVTVWDAATGKKKAKFKTPRPATNGARVATALSDTTLAIGHEKGGTSLWDLATGKERVLDTGHDSKKPGRGYGTYSVAFLPDGKTLATGGRDYAVKLWDVASGKQLHTLAGHYSWVELLVAAPGGKLLASFGQDGIIRLWNPATGADACPLPGHKFAVWNVTLTRDGKSAVTAGWDNTVRWWDATMGAERRLITVREGLMGMTLSPDGKTVLAATDDGKLRVWDAETGREKPTNLPADAKFQLFAFTPDGKHMVAAAGPKVTVWEWPALKLVRTFEPLKLGTRAVPNPEEGGENRCQVVAVSPDGKSVVTVAERHWSKERDGLRYGYASDGVVDVFDFATGKRVRRLAEAKGTFRTGAFIADGGFMLIGGAGTIIRPDGSEGETFEGEMNLLDPVAGKYVRSFEPPPVPDGVSHRYSGACLLAPDGRTLYVSYSTGDIVAYEVATGRPRRTLVGHRDYVGGLATSADGRRLISGGHDSTALVWDVTLAGGAVPRAKPLTEAEAEKLWEAVGRDDSRAALAALTDLAGSPDQAAEVLRRHVKPAPAVPTDAALDRIFSDLSSEDFATREKASKQLEEYGEQAIAGVRKRLEGNLTADARQRAVAFLKPFDKSTLTAARVQQLRAVELLEGLRTPAARKLLVELAAGGSGAPLTLDANTALRRLGNP